MTSKKQLVCFIVASLLLAAGHGAVAQEDEAKPKAPPTRLPSAPVPLRPAPKNAPKPAPAPKQNDTESEPELENELPQFETGVEY